MRYVILPYVATKRRLSVRGLEFRCSDDLEGLGSEETQHLQALFKLFYLQEDLRLKRMSYHVLPPYERSKWPQAAHRLRQCSICLRYLCTRPNPRMPRPVNHLVAGHYPAVEVADMYAFDYCNPPTFFFLPERDFENVEYSGSETKEFFQRIMDGFDGWMIGRGNTFTIGTSGRIYPPYFAFDSATPIRYGVDIAAIFDELIHGSKWALKQFISSQSDELAPLEKRVLLAMDWFAQSCEYRINPLRSLVFLAIAFETLLNLKWEAKNTERFKDVVMVLLGSVERLDSWLDQFFKARGAIVHSGEAEFVAYYPPTGEKKYDRTMPVSMLTDQGQAIFHLCLDAILSSSVTANDARLHADFRHDEERIQDIFKLINKKDDGSPLERLMSARLAVRDLNNQIYRPAGRAKAASMLNLASKMIDLYLSGPSWEQLGMPVEILSDLKDFVAQVQRVKSAKDDLRPNFVRLHDLVQAIGRWQGLSQLSGGLPNDEAFDVVVSLLYWAEMDLGWRGAE
jgi:hypothetical protein